MALTPEQLREFKSEGAVLLPGLVDEEQLASWREQAWDAIAASLGRAVDKDDRSTWPTGNLGNVPSSVQPKPRLGELPQVRALMEFLGDGTLAGGGHMLKAIFPSSLDAAARRKKTQPGKGDSSSFAGLGTASVRAHAAANEGKASPSSLPFGDHMDGSGHHRVCITLYLNDVQEDGGCFMYWKQGHRRIHQFWLEHPHFIGVAQPGKEEFHATAAFQERGWTAIQDLGGTVTPLGAYSGQYMLPPPFPPPFSVRMCVCACVAYAFFGAGTQFVGKAGDGVLWHGWCPHSASVNLRDEPRLALVARWNDTVPLKTAEGKGTFHVPLRPEALFEHWGAGVREHSQNAARL